MKHVPSFDSSTLPEEAQKELYDLFVTLKERHKPAEPRRAPTLEELQVKRFTPMSRDEIYGRESND